MSDDELELPHFSYIDEHDVDCSKMPAELESDMASIDALITAYEADGSDENETKLVSASTALKPKIQAWHEAQVKAVEPKAEPKAEPKVEPKNEPKAVEPAVQNEPPKQAPVVVAEEEDEDDDDPFNW